jgi:hypothetical protein
MTARQKLEAKIAAMTLTQMENALVGLGRQEYSAEVALVNRTIVASIEARFPALGEKVWEVLDRETEGVETFAAALNVARVELAA